MQYKRIVPLSARLNVHGLNFLPHTDTLDMAGARGITTREARDERMFSGMRAQYDRDWGSSACAGQSGEKGPWIMLIYLTQFPVMQSAVRRWRQRVSHGVVPRGLPLCCGALRQISRVRGLAEKTKPVLGALSTRGGLACEK